MNTHLKTAVLALGFAMTIATSATAQSEASDGAPDFEHHRANNDGVLIHAVTLGEGEPVVLIHGFPQHWWMWRDVMENLADAGYQAIAVDQRGMGGSDIPLDGYDKGTLATDIFAVMDELGVEDATVVGYDHGGGTALAMAYLQPERVSELAVLEYTPPGFGYEFGLVASPDNVNWQLGFFTYPDIAVEFISGQERALLSWYFWHWSHNPDAVSQEDFEVYVRQLEKPGALRGGIMHFASVFEDTALFAEWSAAGPLEMPILGIGGELAAGSYMPALNQLGSNVSTAVIEDAGHWLAEEQPEELSRLLIEFIQ